MAQGLREALLFPFWVFIGFSTTRRCFFWLLRRFWGLVFCGLGFGLSHSELRTPGQIVRLQPGTARGDNYYTTTHRGLGHNSKLVGLSF